MNTTTFVVPVFGKPGILTTCLSTLRKFHPTQEVLVVDDCGPDGKEIEEICSIYDAKYFRRPGNGGFAAAVNTGILKAVTPYVCLVNSDLEFTKEIESVIEKRFDFDRFIDVIGGLLFYPNGRIEHGGGYYNYFTVKHYGEGKFPHQAGLCLLPAYRFFVTGALFAIRRIRQGEPGIHLFDEAYKNDSEDADYCLWIWEKSGRVFYDPALRAIHLKSQTLNDKEQIQKDKDRWPKRMESHDRFVRRLSAANVEEIEKRINFFNDNLLSDLPRAFVRTEAVGDVLRTLDVFRELKEDMVVVTNAPEVFRDVPRVIALSRDRDEYAVSSFVDLDLSYERRPKMSIEESYRHQLGLKYLGNMEINYHSTALDWFHVRKSVENDWNRPFVVVHARNRNANRTLSFSFWKELITNLVDMDYTVVVIGSDYDHQFRGERVVDMVGKTNLPMMRALMERAKLFIGMDSGPMHVADGACPAIGIFTIADPDKRVSPEVTPVVPDIPCVGCLHRQTPPLTNFTCEFKEGDPRRYLCTKSITVGMVLEKARKLLNI